ncbi:hypothetical protein COV04_01295 [Candidatus Uhrbacteria bacterium CG10_big_fil_rev_8_21_14_0_10_48_11]|uniref:Glycosyl transferase family 3 domain-containing protein n=1 Tax=Candidatus Uhrbacteria bacterium CG10_big_fil_rev_8_21_14_0_10_48_11 TaxID=1975037 RepID=A0A2M8LFD6_9BACT|nr:MAG: hypothetical protein COV04_01295 [Candidatus Uhrbacteria bacterium CG10_big_fil_rev_8_21_14_0_10_48_11]
MADLFTKATAMLGRNTFNERLLRRCLTALAGPRYNPETAGEFLAAQLDRRVPGIEEVLTALDFLCPVKRRLQRIIVEERVLCTSGTGGSTAKAGVNVTSLATLVAASVPGSARYLKYGNVGSRRQVGSSDLWQQLLKVEPMQLTPLLAKQTLASCGFAVVHAQTVTKRFALVQGARRHATGPTIFNLAGPLTCPFEGQRARYAIGVCRSDLLLNYAGCMSWRGMRGACYTGRIPGRGESDEV